MDLSEILSILSNFRQTITPWDVLDIVIVAYLVYRLITVVRKTSSGSVIKGIVLILAVLWLSHLLSLSVVSFLLGQAMKLGVLVMVILFQPELRRFLEQLNTSNMKLLFRRQVTLSHLEAGIAATVSACMEMAKKKTGALIVFERETSLFDFARTGIRLDSALSSELLTSIFYPKSPLHDGAVIIRNGRVAAASCVLPLTSNINISRDLGMRHRAGIGMSEVSDAVVVIVSEETGSLSVAVGGMLKRHLAQDTFEKLLQNELLPNDAGGRGGRFFDRFRVKQR